jgi:anti-sigma factor RsiW
MEKEKLESLLIDYIDGKLVNDEKAIVEKELQQNESSARLLEQLKQVMNQIDHTTKLEPSSTLKLNFEKALQQEISNSKGKPTFAEASIGRQVFFQPMVLRIAAGFIFLLVSVGIGYWINKNNEQQKEIARLREEMDSTKRMMMAMMTNQQSASQRMLGMAASYQLEKADDEIVNALLKAMNEDPNTNVRLAALDALSKFHQQEHVRMALISALAKQKDPVVQISLIRLMVEMKEKSVIKELDRITKDKEMIKAVKDEAYSGLLKLS